MENIKRTIEEHEEYCDYDLRKFFSEYYYSKDNVKNLINGFNGIEEYFSETSDETLLSTAEFSAVVDYVARENISNSKIKKFIKSIKELNIADSVDILLIVSKYYDELYYDNEKEEIKLFIDKFEESHDNDGNEIRKQNLQYIIDYLSAKKAEAERYKEKQVLKVMDILSEFNFIGIDKYSIELLNLLKEFNYDADYLLSNMPDFELIRKDYHALCGKSYVPKSINLLKDYLLGDKNLSKFENDLGEYNIYKVGMIPVPFTKEEFLQGIHSELEKKEDFEKSSKLK